MKRFEIQQRSGIGHGRGILDVMRPKTDRQVGEFGRKGLQTTMSKTMEACVWVSMMELSTGYQRIGAVPRTSFGSLLYYCSLNKIA